MFLAGANQVVGPQAVTQYLNVSDYFKRRATALGIETEGLIKTEEEIQQAMQQAQMMEMAQLSITCIPKCAVVIRASQILLPAALPATSPSRRMTGLTGIATRSSGAGIARSQSPTGLQRI